MARETKMKNHIVTMSYPSDLFFNSDVESRISKAAGYSGASGMGFGERDHSWYDLTEKQANAKVAKLTALKVEGARVDSYEDDDE
jgi:hypothetical protein